MTWRSNQPERSIHNAIVDQTEAIRRAQMLNDLDYYDDDDVEYVMVYEKTPFERTVGLIARLTFILMVLSGIAALGWSWLATHYPSVYETFSSFLN